MAEAAAETAEAAGAETPLDRRSGGITNRPADAGPGVGGPAYA